MNLSEGKSGLSESTFALSIALCISGLFAFSSEEAYTHGNSVYLSVPLACLLSFAIIALCIFAVKKAHLKDLSELFRFSFGDLLNCIVTLTVSAVLLLCIANLENRFVNLMHMYYFDDTSVYSIAFYFLGVPVILALMGFEVLNSTGKIAGVIFIAVHLLFLLGSSSSYESYKLYPVLGDGILSMSAFSIRSLSLFIPIMIVPLSAMQGLNGAVFCRKTVFRSVIVSVIVCGATLFFLALSATYDELSHLYIPLYRMSMVSGQENFIIRLDKISAFLWTVAALFTCGYCLYGSSLMFCKSFMQRDIRPTVLSFGLSATCLCLLFHSGKGQNLALFQNIDVYGALLIAALLIVASVIALLKTHNRKLGGLRK